MFFAALLNQTGHLDSAKSCKELVQDNKTLFSSLESLNQNLALKNWFPILVMVKRSVECSYKHEYQLMTFLKNNQKSKTQLNCEVVHIVSSYAWYRYQCWFWCFVIFNLWWFYRSRFCTLFATWLMENFPDFRCY